MPADRTPSRREFLKTTAALAAGGAVATAGSRPLLAASPGTAKSCIFINLVGGPSHLDTFDPKPDAPAEVRGPFRPISTRVPGLYFSELFPKLAGKADSFSLIRSMHHTAPPIHECGFQLLNTGRLFRDGPEWPSVGAVVHQVRSRPPALIGHSGEINTGINISHGQGNGWLGGPSAKNLIFPPTAVLGDMVGDAVEWVCRGSGVVTINMFPTVFDAPSWDCHADRGSLRCDLSDYRNTVAPTFDHAFSTLHTNLEDRGLLDSTLVVATGEFGRTPKLNGNGGRDHWAGCWTALIAGGGVKGGRVVGASDRHGTEPAERPVTPQELVSTIFHALGVPETATIPGPAGEPVAVYPGTPVAELF